MSDGTARLRSHRDPAGKLYEMEGRLIRWVDPSHEETLKAVEASRPLRKLVDEGALLSFQRVTADGPWTEPGILLEHPRVWFPSYPGEWAPEMLAAAGRLTLDLAEAALSDGLGLKDATPWNVLFEGSRPVFVDTLSFERRHPQDGTWLALAQFLKGFVYPLIADRELGLAPDTVFSRRRDGWETEELYRLLGWTKRLHPLYFVLVTLPAWLGGAKRAEDPSLYRQRLTASPEKARFLLESCFKSLRRTLTRIAPRPSRQSVWSGYSDTVAADHAEEKKRFLIRALEELRPARLLDAGCNTGEYALLCAERGISTVALDKDAVVIGKLWRAASEKGLPLLPLVLDLARPSPSLGWANLESASFQERATGKLDLIVAYAVLHHLWVGEGIAMEATLEWLHSLACPRVIAEHVSPADPKVEQLRRGRRLPDLSVERFERECERAGFSIERRRPLPGGTRTLYLLHRR
jgi:SAM-dependent methyltransferase